MPSIPDNGSNKGGVASRAHVVDELYYSFLQNAHTRV